VAESYENKDKAAAILNRLNERTIIFLRYLKKKYNIDATDDHKANKEYGTDTRTMIDTLLDNYDPDSLTENDPRFSKDTSYTINKGNSMYICIRDRDNPYSFVDEDVLFFTHLHELSHIANYKSWGHDPQFWATFKFILHEAVNAGVYRPVNYESYPAMFCGLKITYQPLNDKTLPNLWLR
jgi:hypothetical protein